MKTVTLWTQPVNVSVTSTGNLYQPGIPDSIATVMHLCWTVTGALAFGGRVYAMGLFHPVRLGQRD